MNGSDLAKIASHVQGHMALVEGAADTIVQVTQEWQRGPKAASTEPGGGWRHDEDTGEPIPNDPTGEQAINADNAHLIHAELVKRAKRLLEDAAWIRDVGAVISRARIPRERTDDPGPDWCKSCFRDNGYLRPVALHGDGSVHYKGSCRWCAEAPVKPPPLDLLRANHEGRRITVEMWERAVGRKKAG